VRTVTNDMVLRARRQSLAVEVERDHACLSGHSCRSVVARDDGAACRVSPRHRERKRARHACVRLCAVCSARVRAAECRALTACEPFGTLLSVGVRVRGRGVTVLEIEIYVERHIRSRTTPVRGSAEGALVYSMTGEIWGVSRSLI
jgi:hypothetical protein